MSLAHGLLTKEDLRKDVADPLAPENQERPGGRGLLLMRSYMTWVEFNDTGNCVTMGRRRCKSIVN